MIYFFSFLSAVIGGSLVVIYHHHISNRQEKALLVLFIQEYILLLHRCTMYYRQMLTKKVSYSTLFSISDASSFTKLAEVIKDNRIIETVLGLKANFFQVIRYADRASQSIANYNILTGQKQRQLALQNALNAQSTAIVFFVGEVHKKGKFYRREFENFIQKITLLLDYLEKINSPNIFMQLLINCFPKLKVQRNSVDRFITGCRGELDLRKEILELLRQKEELLLRQ